MSDLRNIDRRNFFPPSSGSSLSPFQGPPGGPSSISLADMDGALNQDEAISAIFDIACRLFGARELALYAVEWDFSALHLIGSRGIGGEVLIHMRRGRIGEAAFSGKEYIAENSVFAHGPAREDRLSMCVPFLFNGTSAFVLAIYGSVSLGCLEGNESEIVEFLKIHAAAALNRQPA